ncbi:MAG: pyruvate,water dikinase [Bacteriovoracaceae bacterium]|jgi:phosphoenolpyruvate synthase/pyruvate phosphate dikinase
MEKIIFDSTSTVENLNSVGGKAYNLFFLEREGLPVPKWFCISSHLFQKYYISIKEDIKKIILGIDLNNLEDIKEKSSAIEILFKGIVISSMDQELISKRLSTSKLYAVRSSALDEDGVENSYAGQLSTFLYMNSEQIVDSIKLCWASIFSHRNIQYRLLNEIHDAPKVGVVIQEMVDAKKAGVMFTAHPLLKDNFLDEIVINAGYGAGEGIVSDQVETDTYVFSKSKKKITDSQYNEKKLQMVRNHDGGVKLESVDASKQNISVLTNNEVSKLAGLGIQIRNFYQVEQDIEWCIDDNGNVHITQARPITTIDKGVNKVDFFFDNSNVVESFPGVNTPWTLGHVRDIYSISFRKACLRIGLNRKQINLNYHLFNNLIGIYHGRMFYNLTNWYAMMRFVPFTEKYIKVWEEMLGVRPNEFTEEKESRYLNQAVTMLNGIKIFYNVIYVFTSLDFKLNKLDSKLKALFYDYWEEESKGVHLAITPAASIERIEKFKSELFQDTDVTLINDVYAFVFAGLTKKIIKNSTNLDPDQTFNDLLYGISGMDSIKPLNAIIDIATYVKSDDVLFKKLKDFETLPDFKISHFKNLIDNKTFVDMFNEYIQLYGDRGISELKLETQTYREAPGKLLRLILSYCENDFKNLFQDDQKRIDAEININKQLKSHSKRFFYKFCLRMAKRSINYRENFRLHRSRAYGVLRRMTNNLGNKMKAIGDIHQSRDIYFLEKSDVYNKYTGLSFNQNLIEKVKNNKLAFQRYETTESFERYTIQQGIFHKVLVESKDFKGDFEGIPCSGGIIKGEVLVVKDLSEVNRNTSLAKDKILVSKMTDPGWVFLMAVSKGLIVEKGSILSHTAIIGRELGIPTVVGVKGATELLKSGDQVEVNANTGIIKLLKTEGEENER